MNIQWAVDIPGARVKGLDVAADFQRPTAGNYPDNNSIADARKSGITDKYQYLASLFSKVTANLTMRVKVKLQLSI